MKSFEAQSININFDDFQSQLSNFETIVQWQINRQKRLLNASLLPDFEVMQNSKNYCYHRPTTKKPVKTYHKYNKFSKKAGMESSVLLRNYNDDVDIFLNPFNLNQALYHPQNIEHIWIPTQCEYDIAIKLKKNINYLVNLSKLARKAYMEYLTDVRIVTKDDCRNNACDLELIGHNGLFARCFIPKLTVIGVYSGVFLRNENDLKHLMTYFNYEHISDYLFRVAEMELWPKISAFGVGNRLTIANATSNYKNGLCKSEQDTLHRRTLIPVYGKSLECPFTQIRDLSECPDMLFLVTCRNVEKGEQLLYDYGPVYWANN